MGSAQLQTHCVQRQFRVNPLANFLNICEWVCGFSQKGEVSRPHAKMTLADFGNLLAKLFTKLAPGLTEWKSGLTLEFSSEKNPRNIGTAVAEPPDVWYDRAIGGASMSGERKGSSKKVPSISHQKSQQTQSQFRSLFSLTSAHMFPTITPLESDRQ